MDELTLRLSELETQNEGLEKQVGWLTTQNQLQTEAMKRLTERIQSMGEIQLQIRDEQAGQKRRLHSLRKRLEALSERTDALEQTAARLDTEIGKVGGDLQELSGDMDALYTDMNALVKETRNRIGQMRAEMERFFFDAAERKYDDEGDTMW